MHWRMSLLKEKLVHKWQRATKRRAQHRQRQANKREKQAGRQASKQLQMLGDGVSSRILIWERNKKASDDWLAGCITRAAPTQHATLNARSRPCDVLISERQYRPRCQRCRAVRWRSVAEEAPCARSST